MRGVEGPGSPGIGTFRLNDDRELTVTRALLPYFGRGTINVTGIASEAFGNQVDDDVNVILYNISGDAIERPVQVYGYYGDDRDPGTSGIITLSTQTTETLEKVAYDYVGSGNANFSGAASDVKLVTAYEASGTLFVQGGSAEATTADPADETVLYTFSGNALESYNRAPVIGSGTLTISGAASDIKTTIDEVGSGTLEFSDRAIARVRYIPSIFGSVLFKVGTNLDITCDSDILECDYFSDSLHSLTKDLTDENETASLTVSGSAGTREVDLFQDYTTTGNLTFSVLLQKGLHLLRNFCTHPLQELQKNLIEANFGSGTFYPQWRQRNSDSIQLVELFFMTLVDLLLQELKKNTHQLVDYNVLWFWLELKENLEFLTLSYSKFLVNLIIQTFNTFPTIEVRTITILDLGMNLLPELTKERRILVLHLDLILCTYTLHRCWYDLYR